MIAGWQGRRRDVAAGVSLLGLSLASVLPYLHGGAGFYLDDWRNLARVEEVGWLRSAELGRLASRPGAWAVETVLYPVLRDHPVAWVLVLVGLQAVAAFVIFALLRRFVAPGVAFAVSVVWIVLPNHTSLRVFANTAPMTVGLILLGLGLILVDRDQVVPGALAVAAGALCYEVMLIPGFVLVLVLHRFRGRGDRRSVRWALAILVGAGAAMLVHPTYPVGRGVQGTPWAVLPGHFGAGVTPSASISPVLVGVAVAGVAVGAVLFARGRRDPGGGPWLVVVGLAVLVLGMAAFVLKWPTWYRGQADRHNVVSSVGLAMIWVGIGRLVLARSRVVGVAAAAALGVVLVAANVTFQADWSRAATEARRVVQAIDCQERAGRAGPFVVGPEVPTPGGVRPIHTFYARDAAVVVAGRPLPVSFADSPAAWARVDPASRLTWAELASAPPCDR